MPNKLKSGTHRVSYVEAIATSRALGILAAARGVTSSALIREATLDYLKKHDTGGEIQSVARKLAETMSDKTGDRVTDDVDAATTKAISKILKKFST